MEEKEILTVEQMITAIEQAPAELQVKIAKAFLREDIPNEEIQTTFDKDEEFYKACLTDEAIEVSDNIAEDVEGIGNTEETDGIGAVYHARMSAPSYEDKHWIYYTKGGYNKCILISGNSCLPNCVGYSWGRDLEIRGATDSSLSRANAENWWANTGDGRRRGQTPKLGATICWRKGQAGNASDGAGHVATVEAIDADGTITTSNSGYGGNRFWIARYKYPYNVGATYYFQGFIYSTTDFDPTPAPTPTPEPTPSDKFGIGSRVVINGPLFANSNAATASGSTGDRITTITRKNPGSAHPYNTEGDLGWMNESSIRAYSEPTPPAPTSIEEGSTVIVNGVGTADSYGGGAMTGNYVNHTMKVVYKRAGRSHPYACNANNNMNGVTGWFTEASVRKA